MSCQTFAARQGVHKFVELFDDWGAKKRADLGIASHLTTNPQAEVLCVDNIEVAYITDVHLLDTELFKKYNQLYPGGRVIYGSPYFKYRSDYGHWT